MTTLGQAYVQIMPSSKGISGSIQKTLDPEAIKAGRSAGTKMAQNISNSLGKAGKAMTKAITAPALVAATAVTGIVAAFGWKRLVSVDTAQAQLKGLGYSAEDVERISQGLSKALENGMMTMGEATSAAANAMAAGVKEGKELTKYIQLLDAAVVGGTGSFDEMNQIFAQTADRGHLTANNFDMMATRMPGFSSAMQEHMGVSSDAMRDMLNAGEITTADFLEMMDGFAGGMAEEYAKSWAGMVANTKAYVGIIGEELLDGVFGESKEVIADFIEYLKSDEVMEWAKRTGESINEFFTNLVETVKNAIDWWINLDDKTKGLIKTIALIAVAIGPVLLIISGLINTVIKVNTWFGKLKFAAGLLGKAIGFLVSPAGLAIAAVVAIIAIGVLLYKNWDTVIEYAKKLGNWIKNIWESIKNAISNAWNSIKATTSNVWNSIRNTITNLINSIRNTFRNIFNGLRNIVSNAFSNVRNAIRNGMTSAWNTVTGFFSKFRNAGKNIVTSIADGIKGAIGNITGAIGDVASKVRNFLPFSPAKEGPLKDLDKLNFGGTIADAIDKGEKQVQSAMDGMLEHNIVQDVSRGVKVSQGMTPATAVSNSPSNDNRVINISVDAGNIEELQNVIEIFTGLKQTVRKG